VDGAPPRLLEDASRVALSEDEWATMSGFAAFAVAGLIRAVREASGELSRLKVPADYPHEEVHTLMADTLDRMLLGCIGEGPLRAPSSCITVVEPPAGHRTEEMILAPSESGSGPLRPIPDSSRSFSA